MERLDPIDPLARFRLLRIAHVVPEPERCVECGICVYNCPMGVDVRRHAREGRAIVDRRCLVCGECVRRCPRGALWFASTRGETP